MNYLNYHMIFTLWVINSISCDSTTIVRPCRQLEDQSEFSWACYNIQLDKFHLNPPLNISTTKIDVLGFIEVRGNFEDTILTNYTNLRGIVVFNSRLDVFEINLKTLENLQLIDSSFPIGTKFPNCCSNLEKLTIRNNTGLELESGAFTGLRKLKKLYFANQHLPRITRGMLEGLRSLKKLSLTNTSTTSIDADAFIELTKLKEFYLEDNTIKTIDSNVFQPLRRLTSLTIYGDNLKPLSLEMFSRQRSLVQIGLPLSTWRVIDVEKIPTMFPKLYAHSYVGEWKNSEEKAYFKRIFNRLSQLLLDRHYILILTLWVIHSVSCDSSTEPSCQQLKDHPEFSWTCDNIHLNKYHQLIPLSKVNTTNIDVILFGNVRGKFDASILTNFTRLRSILLWNSTLDLFEVCSKSLENLQLVDSNFPIDTKFTKCNTNLKKLTMRNNTGLEIQSGTFADLRKLKKLYLIHQHLPRITGSTFKGLRSLKKLSLTNTSTASIDADAFNELTKLKEFYLEDNTIETIDSDAFQPLRKLTSLTIYGENLKPLSLDMFSKQRGLVQIGLPLSTWRVIDIEKIPTMFPKLYAHSYVGEWKNAEEKEYFKRAFNRLSQLLLERQ